MQLEWLVAAWKWRSGRIYFIQYDKDGGDTMKAREIWSVLSFVVIVIGGLLFVTLAPTQANAAHLPVNCGFGGGAVGISFFDSGNGNNNSNSYICTDQHVPANAVQDGANNALNQAGITQELANSASHELAHTFGLYQPGPGDNDGNNQFHCKPTLGGGGANPNCTSTNIMEVASFFDGDNRAFSATSNAYLTGLAGGAALAGTKVWLDFSGAHAANMFQFQNSPVITAFGLNAAAITTMRNQIQTLITADYAGLGITFVQTIPGAGNFETLEFFSTSAVPIPGALILFITGLMGLVSMGRRRHAT